MDFSIWLQSELEKREWSQSDLSKQSGLHRAIISKIILGASKPMPETLLAIAKALKVPAKNVFAAAGQFPSDPDDDPWIDEMTYKLNQLDPDLRKIAEGLINSLSEEPKSVKYKQHKPRTSD